MAKRSRPPTGTHEAGGVKLAVKFKTELFHRIIARATKHDKSFSEIVNETCECGLFDLEESEADEPCQKFGT
jgi:hypothetical protein